MNTQRGRRLTWVVAVISAGTALGLAPAGLRAEDDQAKARAELAELKKHDDLSALFRTVAKTVKPAVVEVRVTKWVKEPDMDELMRRFFGDEGPFRFQLPGEQDRPMPNLPRRQGQQRPKQRQFGLGSGVIVDAKNGYVLTNYHVVGEADDVEVVLADGRKFDAEWVRSDMQTDLAIVKIASEKLTEAALGDSDKMEVGDWVLAIGAPRGLAQTVTGGIISAKGRSHIGSREMYQSFIQTDAAINRGNSGGPLVNMSGEVIGINNSIASYSGGNEGIGFAIPSNMAKKVMSQLIEKGKVVRGFLGVEIRDIDDQALAENMGLPNMEGALVRRIRPDSPAAEAGLKAGDFIVSINGTHVTSSNELKNVVADVEVGKTVPAELYRDGKKETVQIKIGTQPKDMAWGGGDEGPGGEVTVENFGLKVATLTKELAKDNGYKETIKGVLIVEVAEGSEAEEKGLQPGMVITHVRNKEVATAEEFKEMISSEAAAKGIRLTFQDASGAKDFVFLRPAKAAK
jgi:serine protease Do